MNTLTIKLRTLGRRMGLHEAVSSIRHIVNPHRNYEDRFHRALMAAVSPADTVWDVGANVGFYTRQFCEWVGRTGHVVAFEPNPLAYRQQPTEFPWMRLEKVALGPREEPSSLVVHGEYTGDGHVHFAGDNTPGTNEIPIQIVTGDSVAARLGNPDVVKIDVEGFEEEVLLGMRNTLPHIRSVLMEIHFQECRLRGLADSPVRIEKMLKASGFRIKWIDGNHIHALRVDSPFN